MCRGATGLVRGSTIGGGSGTHAVKQAWLPRRLALFLPGCPSQLILQMRHTLHLAGGLRHRNKELTCNDGWENASFRG